MELTDELKDDLTECVFGYTFEFAGEETKRNLHGSISEVFKKHDKGDVKFDVRFDNGDIILDIHPNADKLEIKFEQDKFK